jgi:hypothetical protein
MSEQLTEAERELLRKRAERLRKLDDDDAAEEAGVAIAAFNIGDDRFAIPLAQMRAVAPLRLVTAVPLSPPEVIGVLRFDGRVLTAYSLASLLGVRGWRHDPEVLAIVELPDGSLVALDCEQVPVAETIPFGLPEHEGDERWSEVSLGDGSVLHLINLGRLLRRST